MLARRRIAAVLVVVFGLFVAACGSSNNSSSSGGGGGGASDRRDQGQGREGHRPDVDEQPAQGHGQVLPGQGHHRLRRRRSSRTSTPSTARQGYKATLTEFPASADQQRTQFIQRQQAKSDDCDVFSSDVIWTAEFASQKWLYDLTPVHQRAEVEVHRRAARDGALRRQVLGRPGDQRRRVHLLPDRQGRRQAAGDLAAGLCRRQDAGRHRLPGRAVRGPDLRLPRAGLRGRRHGAQRRTARSRRSTRRQNIKALQLMVDGIKGGSAPKAVTTYMEPETDQAWTSGRSTATCATGPTPTPRTTRARARSRASTRSPRCRPSRAAARPASSAATTASSASTPRTRAWR